MNRLFVYLAIALCFSFMVAIYATPIEYIQKVAQPNAKNYVLSLQKCTPSSPWTLHGLWPEWGQNCPGEAFDAKKLVSIRAELDKGWLSCPGSPNDNESFWNHEWTKHGRCTNMDQLSYFRMSLDLRNRYGSKCPQSMESNGECRQCLKYDLSPC